MNETERILADEIDALRRELRELQSEIRFVSAELASTLDALRTEVLKVVKPGLPDSLPDSDSPE